MRSARPAGHRDERRTFASVRAPSNLRVHGDRVWQRAVTLGVRPSDPAPFVKMPLVWERAYGGVATSSTEQRPAFEPRNPIGCGFETDAGRRHRQAGAEHRGSAAAAERVSDRPRPIGVGPSRATGSRASATPAPTTTRGSVSGRHCGRSISMSVFSAARRATCRRHRT